MAPNSPACSFIHASMAGSRSTAPLNRSNSDLIVAPLFSFEIYGYVAYTRRPLACRARRNERTTAIRLPSSRCIESAQTRQARTPTLLRRASDTTLGLKVTDLHGRISLLWVSWVAG